MIKRYDVRRYRGKGPRPGEVWLREVEDPDGPFVRYDDLKAIINRNLFPFPCKCSDCSKCGINAEVGMMLEDEG